MDQGASGSPDPMAATLRFPGLASRPAPRSRPLPLGWLKGTRSRGGPRRLDHEDRHPKPTACCRVTAGLPASQGVSGLPPSPEASAHLCCMSTHRGPSRPGPPKDTRGRGWRSPGSRGAVLGRGWGRWAGLSARTPPWARAEAPRLRAQRAETLARSFSSSAQLQRALKCPEGLGAAADPRTVPCTGPQRNPIEHDF